MKEQDHFDEMAEPLEISIGYYCRAIQEKNIDVLKKTFFPGARVFGILGDKKQIDGKVGALYWLVKTYKTTEEELNNSSYKITSVVIDGDIATASVIINGFLGYPYSHHFLHLIWFDGSWQIIFALFNT